MFKRFNKKLFLILLLPLVWSSQLPARGFQSEPVELLIDFRISGQFTGFSDTGTPVYTIGGPGFSPWYIFKSGEIVDPVFPWRKVVDLVGAQITFSNAPSDPVINFTCLPGSCSMNFRNGSVLQSDAGVPLQGRAINFWGPVINSPDFDPQNGIAPIRILGCGGLKETAGAGPYAGMVGSICFNGALNFNENDPSVLTGSSKCTITLHTPADPDSIP